MITVFILSWTVLCSDGLSQGREAKFFDLQTAESAKSEMGASTGANGCRDTDIKLISTQEQK